MPLMCLVPHCSNGSRYSRTLNKVHSMFNIPKDKKLKRKWEEAIPGDLKLKYGQVVCAKHFLENQLITEFQLKDKFGNIIGKKAYKRPRLKENAVPSIFDIPISISGVENNSNSEEYNYLFNSSKSSNYIKDTDIKYQENNVDKIRNTTDFKILPNNDFDTDLSKIISTTYSRESGMPQESEDNSLQVYYKNIICINNKETEIPKSWNIIKKSLRGELTLIFTHSVSVIVNESENEDKIKKYITYNCLNGNARYFAHGKEVVDAYKVHLLPRLSSTELLLATLIKFEKMKICEGLKKENMQNMITGKYYMDKFNTWRTINCKLLITKLKRCEFCSVIMKKFCEKRIQTNRVQLNGNFKNNAFTSNVDFKNKINSIFETYEKMPVTAIENGYIQEIDSIESSNNCKKLVTRQTYPSDAIKESLIGSYSSAPTTFNFVFEIEKCRN